MNKELELLGKSRSLHSSWSSFPGSLEFASAEKEVKYVVHYHQSIASKHTSLLGQNVRKGDKTC